MRIIILNSKMLPRQKKTKEFKNKIKLNKNKKRKFKVVFRILSVVNRSMVFSFNSTKEEEEIQTYLLSLIETARMKNIEINKILYEGRL